jgi:peptide/nickel transport system substrate-binding protein
VSSVPQRIPSLRCLASVLLASLAAAGCSRSEGRQDNVLRVAIEARVGAFDPRHSTDAASGRIGELVFSRLVKYDDKLEIVPDLAERWDVSDDGLVYRFYLREGVRFHDGSVLDARDVAYTFNSVLDPETKSSKREAYASSIERIEVEDPLTVVFYLKEPNAPFLSNLVFGILPDELAQDPDQDRMRTMPVGSGPFRVVENDNGERVRLAVFEDYFGGRAPLDGIELRFVQDPTIRVLEVKKGTRDFLQNDLNPELLPWLREEEGLKVEMKPGVNAAYLGMHMQHPALSKPLVRQAIAHAIDRETITKVILHQTGTPAHTIIGPANWSHNPNVRMPAYDPARARELLDQAGYPDPDGAGPRPRLSLSYKTSTDKLRLRIAELLRRNLADVGIAVSVQSYEFSTFLNDIKTGNFELYSLIWVGIADPDILYLILHSSMTPPNGLNRVYYENPEVDQLVQLGRVTIDQAERRAIYWKIQDLLAEDLPFVPLYFVNNYAVMRKDVHGFTLYPAGNYYSFAKVRMGEPEPDARASREPRR